MQKHAPNVPVNVANEFRVKDVVGKAVEIGVECVVCSESRMPEIAVEERALKDQTLIVDERALLLPQLVTLWRHGRPLEAGNWRRERSKRQRSVGVLRRRFEDVPVI